MFKLVNFFRTILVVTICLILSSCSQTTSATSSYSGKIGSKSSIEKSRQAKILASRKRAKAIKLAKRKTFLKKRHGKRFSNTRKSSSKSRARKSRYNKKRSVRKKRTRVSSRSASRKHSKRKSKSNAKRIKKSSYAYVGGRSKGIRRNSKPWKCVPGRLKKVLRQVSKKFGRVTINSTHRSKRHNRRVGGKRRSYHLRCQAVDFRVHGKTRGLTRWLANHPLVGGYNRYPSGYYHIDTGPKRTW